MPTVPRLRSMSATRRALAGVAGGLVLRSAMRNVRGERKRRKPLPSGEQTTGALKVVGSIDAERNRVNERHVDAHAVLERAQLLEPLAFLERGWTQRDEALE